MGLSVGDADGTAVDGLVDGLPLGDVDGLDDGLAEGIAVGLFDGLALGLADGLALGANVGNFDGNLVGSNVGDAAVVVVAPGPGAQYPGAQWLAISSASSKKVNVVHGSTAVTTNFAPCAAHQPPRAGSR